LYQLVRHAFLDRKPAMMKIVDGTRIYFQDAEQYEAAKSYISEFFHILRDDSRFNRYIVAMARDK